MERPGVALAHGLCAWVVVAPGSPARYTRGLSQVHLPGPSLSVTGSCVLRAALRSGRQRPVTGLFIWRGGDDQRSRSLAMRRRHALGNTEVAVMRCAMGRS